MVQGDPEELVAKRLERYTDPTQAKQIDLYEDKVPGNRTQKYIVPQLKMMGLCL